MPWVRFDDQFPINRKVARLSDAAFRQYVSAIFWCARNLTDGVVPEEDLEDVCARVRTPERFAAELRDRGLWHASGTKCDSEYCPANPDNGVTALDGWIIHDYLEFQPSKERVRADRKGNAERQKRWRETRKSAEEKRNGVSNTVSNAVSNGGSNAAPARPVPSSSPNGDEKTDSSSPSRGRDQGTRLPDNFPVTDALADWARRNAPSCGPPDHEAFCDYWRGVPGAKGRKLDWPATWRNWMRREHEERQGQNGHAQGRRPAAKLSTSPRDRWMERE